MMVIQNSRVLFASARDKAWPGPVNDALSRLGRFGSPWVYWVRCLRPRRDTRRLVSIPEDARS
ncbi:hypothetical protein [Streptomyces nodosus]|uniref:hypothetical protein n=1 Tax=Streptomyces nodosus TaxID=40318 RepID=UPI0037FD6C1C